MGIIILEEDPNKEGDIDSCGLYLIRFLIISLLNIADLIISIIFFDPNCITFFVFKFIIIFFFFLFYLGLCYKYSYIVGDESFIDGKILPLCIVFIFSIFLIGIEIAFLILFIKNYNALNSIVQIFYYLHWAPIIIIYILLVYRCKKND